VAGLAGREGIRVVVDARLTSGEAGGVEGIVIGLAHGLSELDGPDEFVFVARDGETAWLEPYVGARARIVRQPQATQPPPGRAAGRRARGIEGLLRRIRGPARPPSGPPPARPAGSMPRQDQFVASLQPDVVHMPIQRGFLTEAPSIYHPHDLQHVHLPGFFSEGQRDWRERWYGKLCRRAAMVAVVSEWTRRDVTEHFDLPPEKVRVVPFAPPLAATPDPTPEERTEVRARLSLPERYALYPAQTWPHKNHLRLLEALARLRSERGLIVPLVATGRQTEHFPSLLEAARDLDLTDQVVWTGFVSPTELHVLFEGAATVVVPTLFEAASGPLWEAFSAGVPAACSNVTSLPEQAGDAALVFDPLDVGAIAEAIAALWLDDDLRTRLAERGRARVAHLSWTRTARIFRAHYRRLAGATLTEEDRALLA
jgi:glycosyltransferase involved in cell wall biosynthesis